MGERIGDIPRVYAAVVQYLVVLGRRLCALFRAQEGLATNVVHQVSRGAGAGSEFVRRRHFQSRYGLCRLVALQIASSLGKGNEDLIEQGIGGILADQISRIFLAVCAVSGSG